LTFARTSRVGDGKLLVETTRVIEAETNIVIEDAELDLVFPRGVKVRNMVPR
jgi:hypothetical protein